MKEKVISALKKTGLGREEIERLVEIPRNNLMGDYAFPCFTLSKSFGKNPVQIAKELEGKIKLNHFEKIQANGPYLNFFINKKILAKKVMSEILKKKDRYGSSSIGKGKTIVIEMSSPNIAKPFGVGHLRSTIIGNSISKISKFQGYKVKKINYLGDWGTQFGKLILGYHKFGNEKKIKKDPIKHLLDLYVKVSNNKNLEQEARDWFRKLELGDKKALKLWKRFRDLSLINFSKIYKTMNISFDEISGESKCQDKIPKVIEELESKGLLQNSDGAKIVNLQKYNLGVCLVKKSDGTTLYATRDIAAAIERHKKFKFNKMFYEVGSEQALHFKQVFKILELLGYKWSKDCLHISHGLYLDKDGKKFSTRKGKTIFMEEILEDTINLAKKEIEKRENLPKKELELRARLIALSAIFYGDLKNYRNNEVVFDIEKFLSFEGDTGPYLLYSYARAKSILQRKKPKLKELHIKELTEKEILLILSLAKFSDVVEHSFTNLSPNIIANYAYEISQKFNEFYHHEKVIGSENENFKLSLVSAFSQVLKNSINLLGIKEMERM